MINNAFVLLITSMLLLHTSSAMSKTENQSDIRVYAGIDFFQGKTDLKVTEKSDTEDSWRIELDQEGFKFKWGAILENSWRIQGYFKNEELENQDTDVHYKIGDIRGVGIDVIKTFPVISKFSTFIQTGIGYDWADLKEEEGYLSPPNSINAMTFKLGVGAVYEFVETFEVMAGFDWQYRSWNTFTLSDDVDVFKIEPKDTSKTFYVGLSLFF